LVDIKIIIKTDNFVNKKIKKNKKKAPEGAGGASLKKQYKKLQTLLT